MRRLSRGLLLAATAAAMVLSKGCSPAQDHHIVVVLLDTVRQDALGCYGNPLSPTPAMDAVAGEGVRFTQAVSTSGWTLPAVASLLTGTWPSIHGAVGRGTRLRPIRDELPTAAEVLNRHGFKTLAFTNAAFVSPMLRLDRGFDIFDHRFTYNQDTRRADETITTAVGVLRDHRSQSTFSLIHLFDAHLDYDPPAAYRSLYTGGREDPLPPLTSADCLDMQTDAGRNPPSQADIDYIRGVYQGEVRFVDTQIERLIEQLKALGIYDRTTLIITADHGEEFWDHGGFEHGHTLYDELIRIPLIIRFEESAGISARVIDQQVRILDIMPTVLDLLGIDKPESFAGESLLPLIRGESGENRGAFAESLLYGPRKLAWRDAKYKYIYHGEGDGGELYDWTEDPAEQTDLSEAYPEVAQQLRHELLDFATELGIRARTMSEPPVIDMSPEQVDKLRSLGYIR
jgi:choline-sulfatase